MLVSRTVNLGLIVFAVALLVGTVVEKSRSQKAAPVAVQPYEPVTVIDVAHGVDAGTVAGLVRLRGDERVVAVDDQTVSNDFAAGAAIAERTLGTGRYLDLTVGGASGTRRVLVLMH